MTSSHTWATLTRKWSIRKTSKATRMSLKLLKSRQGREKSHCFRHLMLTETICLAHSIAANWMRCAKLRIRAQWWPIEERADMAPSEIRWEARYLRRKAGLLLRIGLRKSTLWRIEHSLTLNWLSIMRSQTQRLFCKGPIKTSSGTAQSIWRTTHGSKARSIASQWAFDGK